MSATTSFANPEPPPLLFGSPPFSPRSPLHTQTPAGPPPVAMEEAEDVDMTTSTILPAQNHDRQDEAMEDGGENEAPPTGQEREHTNSGNNALTTEEAPAGDAMDTTPDASPQPEPTNEPQPIDLQSQGAQPLQDDMPPPLQDGLSRDDAVPLVATDLPADASIPRQASPPPAGVHTSSSEGSQSPSDPASAPVPPPQHSNDDSSSEDSDDDILQWQQVIDDTSAPDEDELKEIERETERSALDDEYWRKRTHVHLPDPEHQPGPHGTITWNIEKLNGTREEPNTELIMESEAVQIGDHKFRIKLYPDSVDESRYFSVFLTCDSMVDPKKKNEDRHLSPRSKRIKKTKKSKNAKPVEEPAAEESKPDETLKAAGPKEPEKEPEWQHTPLPLLDPKRIPKRPSVAAQFMIVMYNPDEPRSHYHMTFSHRFCPGAPDHGTMHFGFSKSDAAIRRRLQRQAIYRNDKLSFKAHVRLINDETGCLWERSSRDNPYDSLMITGLQGISNSAFGLSGGNVISAISTWMLLMPFRELLYKAQAPNPLTESRQRPKPMLLALQKILYCLRTRPEGVGNGPFALEDLLDAFEWYALDKATDKYDTIEIWEILRSKLEEELQGTPWADSLDRIFGIKRNRATGAPCYKVPVRECDTMQNAIDKTSGLVDTDLDPPQVLTLELERYIFDDKQRSWRKLNEKLKLDESVVVGGQQYKLFGFIVHKENAQSGSYYSVLRPDGPQGKWFMYTDNRDENKVMCLTRKAAVDAHEGSAKKNEQASVAYVVTYLREDVAATVFDVRNEPEWEVPGWMVEEVKRERDMARDIAFANAFDIPPSAALNATEDSAETAETAEEKEKEDKRPAQEYEFSVIRSDVFAEHTGPGLIDLYDANWDNSQHLYKVTLQGDANATKAREQVANQIGGIKDPRQCKLWIVGSPEGTLWRPNLITTGKKEISGGGHDFDLDWTVDELVLRAPERRLWLHVIDEKDLPPLPEPPKEEAKAEPEAIAGASATPPMDGAAGASDLPVVTSSNEAAVQGSADQPMGNTQDEVVPSEPTLPAVNTIDAPVPVLGIDTDMGDISALPPMPTYTGPPRGIANGLPPLPSHTPLLPHGARGGHPPPPGPVHNTDEIYFFLKTYDSKTGELKPRGSYFVERHGRVDKTLYKILGLDKSKNPLDFWEEEDISSARPLTVRNSFSKEDLTNGSIIVLQEHLEEEQKEELSAKGLFADPNAYLRALGEERSFPNTAKGSYKMDYFSSEFYQGDMRHHMPHGLGKKIYHNANAYTGNFVMGQRHGRGSMTFANGDTYEGEWVNGQQQGHGIAIELETGNKYEGNWKGGKKYGEGVTYWKVAQEEERSCKICWEKEADAVFVDCGHVVSCLGCARQVKDCPICRRPVNKAIKLYLVA